MHFRPWCRRISCGGRRSRLKAATQIDYLTRVLELDRRDWSLAFEDHSLSFFDGILIGILGNESFYFKEDFINEILGEIAHRSLLQSLF